MTPNAATSITLDVQLDEHEWQRHLAAETRRGLVATPPWTPPVWFYDKFGSQLFDEITRLPEYYPTNAERSILQSHADTIAALAQAHTLVELGSGTSDKTRLLIEAMLREGSLELFVPFDVSQDILKQAAGGIASGYGLDVHAIVGDFTSHLSAIPNGNSKVVAFLGSTIGNFDATQRMDLLRSIADTLSPSDSFLLGTDLIKDVGRLVRAYDDSLGVTAQFNRNALNVMNRQLGSDFHVASYRHEAVWNADESRIEMHLVASGDQLVTFRELRGLQLRLGDGEWLRTEISTKFSIEQVTRELAALGLVVKGQWFDPNSDFMVTLARPVVTDY